MQNSQQKIYYSKRQPQKRLKNISLLNILQKSTNVNVLGHSLQGKLQTYVHIFH